MSQSQLIDWGRISHLFQHVLKLDTDQQEDFFKTLDTKHPEDALVLRQLTLRETDFTGFMAVRSKRERPEVLQAGEHVGIWVIETLIGSGGMGQVYTARRQDGLYDKTVALKLAMSIEPERLASFERERRQLARLDHPNIARIVDGGQADNGRPYLAMDYVQGETVTQYCKAQNATRTEKLNLFLQLCEAVGHAHSKLLLHRDIKPSNVLVDALGNVRLIDFGVSTLLEGDAQTGGPITFAYAAPEQLLGEEIGVSSDVFALGVLLHELLAGHLPERLADGGVQSDHKSIGHDECNAIIERATATDRNDRFISVSELAADLQRVLNKEPVAAYSDTRRYRARKFIARNPMSSILAAAFIVTLLGGITATLYQTNIANQQRDVAEVALAEKEQQFEQAEAMLLSQSAYAETLYEAFGADGRGPELTALLMARWENIFDKRDTDPDNAAATSFALFRNFYIRRDIPNAAIIAEAWLEEKSPIGPEALVKTGEELYAMFLFDRGERESALPRLRAVLKEMEAQTTRTAIDKMAIANRIANASLERADYETAEKYMLQLVDEAVRPQSYIEAYGSLGILNESFGEYKKATEFYTQALEQFSENPDLALPARGLLRARQARLLLLEMGESEQALELARLVTTQDAEQIGESAITSRGYWVQTRAHIALGQIAEAQAALVRETELAKKFEGVGDTPQISSLMAEARIAALNSDYDVVDEIFSRAESSDELRESLLLAVTQIWVQQRQAPNEKRLQEELRALPTLSQTDSEARWIVQSLSVGLD